MYKSPGTFQSNHINISVNMLSSFLPVIREKAPVCTVNQMYSLFKNLTLLNISFHVPLPFNSQPLPVTWVLPIGFKIYSNLYHWRKTHLTMITVFLIFFPRYFSSFPFPFWANVARNKFSIYAVSIFATCSHSFTVY